MSDRLQGSSPYNPIKYKGYNIYLSDLSRVHGFAYDFAHDSYDGAEDAHDNRYGHAYTIEEAKLQIDEMED